ALAPVAHASPPDQSWIGGLYDDADFDDVILLITGDLNVIQPRIVWSLDPVAAVVGLVTAMDTQPRAPCALSSALSRAPPPARSPAECNRPISSVGPRRLPLRLRRLFEADAHVAHGEDDVEADTGGAEEDPARRLVELRAEPRSTDQWEQRR